jgi:succinyldiaminopimelate transaminase
VTRWERLPDFPWDTLAPFADIAREHADGAVDLSIGTPVDSTPQIAQSALVDAANSPGYPTTIGMPELRAAAVDWLQRRLDAPANVGFLPSIGSKEAVASLPLQLGLGASDIMTIPEVAYPTYAVGGVVAGCTVVVTDHPESVAGVKLAWINSPSNPTGEVLSVERLRELVSWARSAGVILANDECYIELGWEAEPVSILDQRVNDGDLTGLLALHSLSKRSNLAGYRFGFFAGDPALTAQLLAVRKHLGLMVPSPVQQAAIACLLDDEEVLAQRARYAQRRTLLRSALETAGFRIDHSEAGLYLWASRDEDCWDSVRWCAERGVIVTPGSFYGQAGERHIRVALTATDERVAAAVARLVAA